MFWMSPFRAIFQDLHYSYGLSLSFSAVDPSYFSQILYPVMTKMYSNESAVKKSQPWKILLPQGPDREQLRDISTLTDRPWARLILAQRHSKLAGGPRQHRYPEHDKDRKADPFKGIYKAECKCGLK